jgi:hypothetical protein
MHVQRFDMQCDDKAKVTFMEFSIPYPRSIALASLQQCSTNYPENGPLPPDAPSWCQAPFDPEGLLRSVPVISHGHILRCKLFQLTDN